MFDFKTDDHDDSEDIDEKLEQQSQRIREMAEELDEQLKDQDPARALGGIHLLRTQMLTSLEKALSLAERIANEADDRDTALSHSILANRLRDILNYE